MNQVVDETVQNFKCTPKNKPTSKKKNKKAKDLSDTTDDVNIIKEDKLCESLANNVHINNINYNLTNGTSEHADENNCDSGCDRHENNKLIEQMNHINNVHYDNGSNGISEESQSCSEVRHIRDLVEEALQNLENTLNLQEPPKEEIEIVSYESELQMPEIMRLIQKDLSEPYSIYTYRYFIHNWPKLCFLAMHEGKCMGAIVCKLDMHRNVVKRGYIAMLAVDEKYRKKRIGSRLVQKAIQAMCKDNADEVVLETEITNRPALKLYENLGFVRDKRLFRYYLNGVDALRLKLWLR